MINEFKKYLVFIVVGALPTALAGYGPADVNWWLSVIPLWITIALRDDANKNPPNNAPS